MHKIIINARCLSPSVLALLLFRISLPLFRPIKKDEKNPIRKTIRQGNTTSPKSFTACAEVFDDLEWDGRDEDSQRISYSTTYVSQDVVLLSESEEN